MTVFQCGHPDYGVVHRFIALQRGPGRGLSKGRKYGKWVFTAVTQLEVRREIEKTG